MNSTLITDDILALICALVISTILTPIIRELLIRWEVYDKPDFRKMHLRPIPSMGGLAIYTGFIVSVFMFVKMNKFVSSMIMCATLLVILGIIDDFYILSTPGKLMGQIIVAVLTIFSGVKIEFVSSFSLFGEKNMIYLQYLSVPITIVWILAVINSVNLIDGLDGLAGGITTIVALTLAVVGYLREPELLSGEKIHYVIRLALILTGATIGFLWFNFHPASIFMGDTGSMFLGYVLAVISIMGAMKGATMVALLVPLLALGLPLFDSILAVLRRKVDGKPIFSPDKEHFHHQFLDIGLSHRQVVLLFYLISTCLGGWAIYISTIKISSAIFVFAFLSFLFFFGAWRVRKVRKKVLKK